MGRTEEQLCTGCHPAPHIQEPEQGWDGGYLEGHKNRNEFSYPDCDLSKADVQLNTAKLNEKERSAMYDNLHRQMRAIWPEFSWKADQGAPGNDTRCYQKFLSDISRIGYSKEGKVISIICPQQGYWTKHFTLNVEVTVDASRGWVNERGGDNGDKLKLAADLQVTGKLWFTKTEKKDGDSTGEQGNTILDKIAKHFISIYGEEAFPFGKETAIEVETHRVGDPSDPWIPLRMGENPAFVAPPSHRHQKEAFDVAWLEVQIGGIKKTEEEAEFVTQFKQSVVNLFNLVKGNMLQKGNVLTWNIWFDAPHKVDREEWAGHAKLWRESIQKNSDILGKESPPVTYQKFLVEFKPLPGDNTAENIMSGLHQLITTHMKVLNKAVESK